jgi:chemotaxis protein methyltransferase CheR
LAEQKKESLNQFLDNMAFQKAKRMLEDNAGINCSGFREEYLRRRFEIRLRATGTLNFGKYIVYLKRHPEEFKSLMNEITVNYTMFFRDTDVYTHLEKVLLPKLLRSSDVTRIWSAGCATGEEPYSLAILALKVLGQQIEKHPVVIYASDIDKEALAVATNGQYSMKQLSNIDAQSLDRFFKKENENYTVKDEVKKIVHFQTFDLMSPPTHENLDLILCRNVMIYFSKQSQQQIHLGFFGALKKGGFLITGKSEILSGEPASKFLAVDQQARVYRKPETPSEHLSVGMLPLDTKPLSV